MPLSRARAYRDIHVLVYHYRKLFYLYDTLSDYRCHVTRETLTPPPPLRHATAAATAVAAVVVHAMIEKE